MRNEPTVTLEGSYVDVVAMRNFLRANAPESFGCESLTSSGFSGRIYKCLISIK
jgi:hypothetical protein